jgi:hypothetical protein
MRVPIARPQLDRDRAVVLDRQVRDAAAGVEDVGVDEGAGRAGVEAGPTCAAARALRRAADRRQRRGDQELTQDHVAAQAGRDHHRVLGGEAQAGGLGPLAFGQRRCVDAHAVGDRADRRGQRGRDLGQAIAHDQVVVGAAGVARDLTAHGGRGRRGRRRAVGERDHDDRLGRRQERARVGAAGLVLGAGEVGHLAVVAGGQPVLIERCARRRRHRDDADPVEPGLAGRGEHRSGGLGRGRAIGGRRCGHGRASTSAAPSRSSSSGTPAKYTRS